MTNYFNDPKVSLYADTLRTAWAAHKERLPTFSGVYVFGQEVWLIPADSAAKDLLKDERVIAQAEAKREQDAIWRARFP